MKSLGLYISIKWPLKLLNFLKMIETIDVKYLQPIAANAIKTANIALIKELLASGKLDFERDFMTVAKEDNNESVMKVLNEHVAEINRVKLEKEKMVYEQFKDILLNKYQTLDPYSDVAQQDLKLHNFLSVLEQKKPNCMTFNEYSNGPIIVSNATFKTNFDKVTAHIFDDFNWSNVIVAGESVRQLLESDWNRGAGTIVNTTLDLILFGPTREIINNKWKNLMRHLYQFEPISVFSKSIRMIIIPKLKCMLNIMSRMAKEPGEIINDYAFNYNKLYYDGKDVHTTIGGLIARKYGLATFDKFARNNVDVELKEIIEKGFVVMYNSQLKYVSTMVRDYSIDTKSVIVNNEIDDVHKKFGIIMETLPKLDTNKRVKFVALIFSDWSVTKNCYF